MGEEGVEDVWWTMEGWAGTCAARARMFVRMVDEGFTGMNCQAVESNTIDLFHELNDRLGSLVVLGDC